MKITAMQELEDKLKDNLKWIVMNADYELMDKLFKEGVEKEKEQIIDAFDYGYHCASNGTSAEITLDGKMHYNQTYNQNK